MATSLGIVVGLLLLIFALYAALQWAEERKK